MNRPPPTVYLLYGDDDLAVHEFVGQLHERLGDPSTADMNTQLFFAKGLDLGAFEEACNTLPFIAPRRLVFLDHAEGLPSGEAWRERFFTILTSLPPSTALLLVEHVDIRSEKDDRAYKKSSSLYQWCETRPDDTFIRKFATPRGAAFISWLRNRCRQMGGDIETSAAHQLAESVAEDAYMASHELAKLLDYVDRKRPIQIEDVDLLTPFHGQSDVFAMVDSIGQRNGSKALRMLHRLLDEDNPLYAFAMIVRQFRLLIQAREALDEGIDPKEVMRVHPYVAGKIGTQARNFSRADLDYIYHRLLSIDRGSKSSSVDREVELDSLITALSEQRYAD
jgi:DNA polymerase-3 subunit delta